MSLEITVDGTVLVRAPLWTAKKQCDAMVASHLAWIEKHLSAQREKAARPDFTEEEREGLIKAAKEYLPARVEHYSRLMGVAPTGITVTGAQTRYGSCSPKNRLCFSWRLMQYPKSAVDSVIVHELAHIRHKNHGAVFYAMIEKYMPDYRARKKLLHGLKRDGGFTPGESD